MLSVIEDYYMHFEDKQQSFISKIYGVYEVKLSGVKSVNFMLMKNTI